MSPRRPVPSPHVSEATEPTLASKAAAPTLTVVARRGLLLGAPAVLLAGCGLIGGGGEQEIAPAGGGENADAEADGDGGGADQTEEAVPTGVATVSIDGVVIEDVMDVGDLVDPLEGSETLLHPRAAITVTGMALLHELTPERYTELTGEEVPPSDDDEDTEATVIRPGDLQAFLVATWESTDSEWQPAGTRGSTTLSLAVGGNVESRLVRPRQDETEHSGAVLLTVPASPQPEAATVHAETEKGAQQISLIDGSIVSTIAPRLYAGDLEVEVSEADVLDVEVSDGVGADVMHLRGTVASAYLTPYIGGVHSHGGSLGWADEDEIYVVVQLDWDKDFAMNVKDVSRIVLQLPDGTEVAPEQDESQTFGDHADNVATFVMPAETESATAVITPRFQKVLDEDFDETYDPVAATLTFL